MSISLEKCVVARPFPVDACVIGLLFYRRIWRHVAGLLHYCIWDLLSNVLAYLIYRYYSQRLFHCLLGAGHRRFHAGIRRSGMSWLVCAPACPRPLSLGHLDVIGALILVAAAAIWPIRGSPGLVDISKQGLLLVQLQQNGLILRVCSSYCWLAAANSYPSAGAIANYRSPPGLGLYSLAGLDCCNDSPCTRHPHSQYHTGEVVSRKTLLAYCIGAVSFAQKKPSAANSLRRCRIWLLSVAGAAQ